MVSGLVTGEAEGVYPASTGLPLAASSSAGAFFLPIFLKRAAGLGRGMSGSGSLKGSGISLMFPILDSSWMDLLC